MGLFRVWELTWFPLANTTNYHGLDLKLPLWSSCSPNCCVGVCVWSRDLCEWIFELHDYLSVTGLKERRVYHVIFMRTSTSLRFFHLCCSEWQRCFYSGVCVCVCVLLWSWDGFVCQGYCGTVVYLRGNTRRGFSQSKHSAE